MLTGIHQYSTGVPVTLSANNTLPLFNGILRPDVISGVSRATNLKNFDPAVNTWITRDAFRAPAALRFGTSARAYTDLRAPNFLNENFGLLKRFSIKERVTPTVRGELFNAFNRTVLGPPQGNVSNALFGRIMAQANQPCASISNR